MREVTLHHSDPWLTVHVGDCRDVLATLPERSVHTVVTSPPYWGLRSYGVGTENGELGLEATPEEYVTNMVAVFREVRRVLRDDGTLWLNLGDTFSGQAGGPQGQSGDRATRTFTGAMPGAHVGHGLKPKDLVGIPWRVAFALQQPYYTGHIPVERDRTWLAALVDGEGTFTILCTTSPHGSGNSYPPIAQVRMTSAGVVAKAASLVGVASPAQYPPSSRGNRPVYQWRLSGSRAAELARELYPYLIEKRKQALIAWNHQAVRDSYETKRGVTIPAAALDKQHVCRDLIRRLNHGEDVDIPSWMVEPPGMTEPGWYLRSDVIWSKPNPMPESVTDRPTKSHEYLFLLAKQPRYYFDQESVRLPVSPNWERGSGPPVPEHGYHVLTEGRTGHQVQRVYDEAKGANVRTVWTIATQPYPGAHFATFPQALVEPCVKAGTSERGVCPACGSPWRRVVASVPSGRDGRGVPTGEWDTGRGVPRHRAAARFGEATTTTTGWAPTCDHGGDPVPAVILDPFGGSGTVGVVAQRLSRRAVLIDLNADYIDQQIARNRDIPLGLSA